MAPSDGQRELLIVFNFVRAKDDRSILVLSGAATEAQLRSRRERCSEQHRDEHTDDRETERCPDTVPASRHQPSSRWSSIEAPKIKLTPVGVHAASVTGTLAESPKANMMSDKKYRRNPATTPPTIIKVAPPRRCMRKLKVAATRTIAHNKNGRASSTLKCKRWRCAGKPDCSSNPMKPGRSQKDMVSGEAKLSSILRGVRVVARRSSAKG